MQADWARLKEEAALSMDDLALFFSGEHVSRTGREVDGEMGRHSGRGWGQDDGVLRLPGEARNSKWNVPTCCMGMSCKKVSAFFTLLHPIWVLKRDS